MCVRRVVTPCLAEPGAWEHARARHERELTSAAAAAADEEAGGETSLDPTWWMPPTSCLPVRCPPRDRAARHGNTMCREEGVAGRGNKLRAREEVRTGKERRGRSCARAEHRIRAEEDRNDWFLPIAIFIVSRRLGARVDAVS